MNLHHKKVLHRTFGRGSVQSAENGRITVQFTEEFGEKRFPYPGAFSLYLQMEDPKAQDFVMGELQQMLDKLEKERAHREEVRLEQERTEAEEKAALKKSAAKKTTKKKA